MINSFSNCCLAILYSFIPIYEEQIANGNIKRINVSYTKSSIVNVYVLIEDNKWDEIKQEVNKSLEFFNTVINSIEVNNNEQNIISKIYIGINEISNAINLKDKKLFYLKYINLMECIIKI